MITPEIKRAFLALVKREGAHWIFTGSTHFYWPDLPTRSPRAIMWTIRTGQPPPDGQFASRACDIKGCVRHLVLTPSPNGGVPGGRHLLIPGPTSERAGKHGNHVRGAKHPKSRLNEASVREIRAAIAAGQGPCELARRYGVTAAAVIKVANRRSWAHVA